MWNTETVARLDAWYQSEEGNFALVQEHRLFQHLVSCWPRRGRTLLDLGCSPGVFLNMFREYGFDVTGIDISEEMLAAARMRMQNRADFRIGQLEHLPFDAGDFDYVAILSVLEYVSDPEKILAEAIRVASRGVVVGFMNSWSLAHCADRMPFCRFSRRGRWLNLPLLLRMAHRICPSCRPATRSALFGSPCTWKKQSLFSSLNRIILPLPFGAYTGLRIDTEAQIPLTPLLLKREDNSLAAI